MNALVIVDPQNDFINGSLAVPGAEKAINNTIEFIKEHKEDLAYIAITADWHPYDHCSFKEYGGTWESHCVMYSAGASIYQPLLEVIKETGIFCKVWNKGTYSDREEYSIFDREEGREFLDELNDRTTIDASKEEYGEIYVAGLAGDFCVFHTVKDLVDEGLGDWMHILLDGVASIDGGVKLKNLLKESEIEEVVKYVSILNKLKPLQDHWGICFDDYCGIGYPGGYIGLSEEEYNTFIELLSYDGNDTVKIEIYEHLRSENEYSFLVFQGVEIYYYDENNTKYKVEWDQIKG